MAAASALFRLDTPGKDGQTLRQRLNRVWEKTGKKPDLLKASIIPPLAVLPFEWWRELHRGRRSNGWGWEALGFEAIAAWSALRGIRPSRLELSLIHAIDRAFLAASNKKDAE